MAFNFFKTGLSTFGAPASDSAHSDTSASLSDLEQFIDQYTQGGQLFGQYPQVGDFTGGGGFDFGGVTMSQSLSQQTILGALKTGGGQTTPAPTLISSPNSNLKFNLIWDSSVANAGTNKAAFMLAVENAAQFYVNNYTTPYQTYTNAQTGVQGALVINLHVGYGEVAGSSLPFGALAASSSEGDYVSYATLEAALNNVNHNSGNSLVANYTLALPSAATISSETGQAQTSKDIFVPYAEEMALGLPIGTSGYQTSIDGWIGISKNSFLTKMDYTDDPLLNKTGAMPTNAYDAVSAAAHEIAEVMGRISGLGTSLQAGTGATWTALDLARFTSSGAPDLTTKTGYFSLDNGATNLGTYNAAAGDAGDWTSSAYDSYGFAHAGYYSPVSATDVLENAILGYGLTSAGLSAASSPTRVA
jgi:hypothetical protein